MVGSSSENKEEKYRDPGGNWLLVAGCPALPLGLKELVNWLIG